MRLSLILGLALSLMTVGCGDDDTGVEDTGSPDAGDTGGEDTGGGGSAMVRLLHLSPDAPAVDIFLNGERSPLTGLAFPNGTPYAELPAGSYDVDIVPAGGEIGDSVLTVQDLALEADTMYSAAAIGTVAGDPALAALPIVDSAADLDAANIRVRAIHAAAAVGQVDIWNITDPAAPAALYEDVDFGVAGDALDVPAGAYTIGLDVDDDATPDVIFELPELAGGTVVNLYAVNDMEGNVFIQAALPDGTYARIDPTEAGSAMVRLLHIANDAPAVDIFINGERSPVTGFEFGETTPYVELDAGAYEIDIVPAGLELADSVFNIPSLALEANTSYSAAAIGTLAGDPAFSVLPIVDSGADLADGNIRVRAIHAASSVGQVDIWNITDTPAPLYEDVDFGVAGDALDVPAGAYTIGFDVDDDATPDVTFALPDLPAGTVVNLYAANEMDGTVFLIAALPDGTSARIDAE